MGGLVGTSWAIEEGTQLFVGAKGHAGALASLEAVKHRNRNACLFGESGDGPPGSLKE